MAETADTEKKIDLAGAPTQVWIDYLTKQHREVFAADPGGELMSMFFAETREGQMLVIAAPFGDEDEKAAVLGVIRQMFQEHDVVRYAHVSEVWMARPKEVDTTGFRPSEQPDRVEGVMTLVCAKDAAPVSAMQRIVRDEAGRVTALEDMPDRDGGVMGGRMTELLVTTPPTAH